MNLRQMDLKTAAGQLIFYGFDGYEINDHVRRVIRQHKLGNIILFTRNIKNSEQLFRLIQELREETIMATGLPPFIAIDQEGGSVTRLTSEFTWFPGPMATRAAGGEELARKVGQGIGAEMAAYGMNFDLAPVIDLANDPNSAHIAARSYGATPEDSAPYFTAFIQGAQEHVITTAKHFPSIGSSQVDLHLFLNRNEDSLEHLQRVEMAATKYAVEAGVKAVMTSHQIYPAIEDCPGTLSHELLTSWLRQEFGFEGLIVSDCMEMKGLADYVPTPEGCVRGVLAGIDLFLVCHTESTQVQSAQAIEEAVRSGRISQARLFESVERIVKAKEGLPHVLEERLVPATHAMFTTNRELVENICEEALTVEGDTEVFKASEEERFLIIAPPPAALTMVDELGGIRDLVTAVTEVYPNADGIRYSLPLQTNEADEICEAISAGRYTKALLGVYNAHMDEGQRRLLRQTLDSDIPVGVIALRSPFDIRWCNKAKGRLIAYEYTPPMIKAIVQLLQGKVKAKGTLPIAIERTC